MLFDQGFHAMHGRIASNELAAKLGVYIRLKYQIHIDPYRMADIIPIEPSDFSSICRIVKKKKTDCLNYHQTTLMNIFI